MLSEQEKKAIKLIKQYREEIKNKNIKPIFILDTAINLITKLQKENEEKDKQIDLMAETIRKLAISLASYKGSYNKETINFTGNIKDIKQYFEQKATKNS